MGSTLQPLIAFLTRAITTPPFASILVAVANLILDMYAGVLGQSAPVDELFVKLRRALESEVQLQVELAQLMGAMDVLLAGATASSSSETVDQPLHKIRKASNDPALMSFTKTI